MLYVTTGQRLDSTTGKVIILSAPTLLLVIYTIAETMSILIEHLVQVLGQTV